MKVIHLISGGDSGGAKTHVLSLLQNLNQTITAQLVCFRDGPFAEEARSRGIPTEIMGGNNIPRLQRQLKAYIRAGGYQLIHCHGSRANMVGALLRRSTGLPVVSTIHSDYRLDYMGRPLSRLTFGTINAWALRHLDYRIGVSDAMVDLLISRGFPPDRFYAIYNGIDFTPPPAQGERLPYLRSLGVDADEDSVVVGIAARLNPVKDMATLVRGYAAACRTCPRLRLVIAGEGPEREKLGALAQELGVNVTFAGWISGGMDQFYSALDINALTSLSETFPYALTEGARFRLATVASAVGGIPDLIDSGVNGCLFQPGDWQTLGEHLAALGSNDTLRRQLGEKLYEKASSKFSIQKTVDTQLHIYQEILRRHSRLKTTRDGVVICGAYGRGNAGDDAILEAILQEMALIDPDMPATVLSKEPKSTRLAYRVRSVSRTNMFAWHSAMRHAKLYINGGGSLIQDVTSRRSLWFYLLNIAVAKRCGCKVQMYGCGIGPIVYERDRQLAARIINGCVDKITLREPDSRETLSDFGVTEPEVILASDPALTLQAAERGRIDRILREHDMDPDGKYIGFVLRKWPGIEEKATVFAAGAVYAYLKYGLTPVFLSINFRTDGEASQLVTEHLSIPFHVLGEQMSTGEVIGVLSRMTAVVSMRLHGLIFAAGQGVPLIGVAYDPKVTAFLDYVEQTNYMQFEAVNEEDLSDQIDAAVALAGRGEELRRRTELLNRQEDNNRATAARLLGKE